jgi:alpha-tubulin suppressor-like RCC1 family protein
MAGSGQFGKIAINSTSNNFRGFKVHELMKRHMVKKIAIGDYHTLAITEEGALYTWGGKLWDKTGHKGEGIVKI